MEQGKYYYGVQDTWPQMDMAEILYSRAKNLENNLLKKCNTKDKKHIANCLACRIETNKTDLYKTFLESQEEGKENIETNKTDLYDTFLESEEESEENIETNESDLYETFLESQEKGKENIETNNTDLYDTFLESQEEGEENIETNETDLYETFFKSLEEGEENEAMSSGDKLPDDGVNSWLGSKISVHADSEMIEIGQPHFKEKCFSEKVDEAIEETLSYCIEQVVLNFASKTFTTYRSR